MKQLFGTDGIRGHAGEFPLDDKTIAAIGDSLARQLSERLGRPPRFVSGRDTRESGQGIEAAFHAGAESAGAACESAGVITTPGVAYLAGKFGFDAGIVISASHNPFQDNGIKIFAPTGRKIVGATERAIEADIYSKADVEYSMENALHSARGDEFAVAYIEHLKEQVNGLSADGIRIIIDCANGAASGFAPKLFKTLGANVVAIQDAPDGRNINENCGSLHLEHLQAKVVEERAAFGVAFDGDADRALFVDETGNIIDGDATLWVMARYLKDHGHLRNSTVVATVMSNIGLEKAFEAEGIALLRTDVGDKFVLDKLVETGSEIGGEQSGHIIFPEISWVGDGMMTALLLLRAISEKGVSLSDATAGFKRYPQILVNVRVGEKRPFNEVPAIAAAAAEVERELHGEGRLLLRYSGTENLARVMIEGKDQTAIDAQANRLAEVIRAALG
ncbi:MAG: phosphoglucosamine mutase [Pyrinomonadaceae bacterium]